ISLNSTHIVQGIETQGRYGNGTGAEYVNEYYIDYFRFGAQWIRYKNRTGHSLLAGNWDTTTAVLQILDPPIIASKIRIVPHSEQTRTMCLRVELHGCEDFENLIAYSLNREGSGDLRDRIFEDTKDVDTIMGGRKGFGILTDGIIASNSPYDSFGRPWTNSTWIGWSHNSTFGKIIVIFEFDKIKNFTDVELFAWGEPIDLVEVEFSKDGNAFNPENTVRTRYPSDASTAAENPTTGYSIHIPLPNRSGKFV
uniref:F5/8 type C domain-containing protein n=1 Tax=Panagrolaimus sp. ES5 TaxID=591445 RepID=A0AC34GGZ1_9BILA